MKDIKDIMKINSENLAKVQFEALKDHTLEVLDRARGLIEKNEFCVIGSGSDFDICFYSDGYGGETYCLDFGYGGVSMDIAEVCRKLEELMSVAGIDRRTDI